MNIWIFSIFPEMFSGPLNSSILKKAQEKGLITVNVIDFRPYSPTKHKNVDDSPFGGGAGMVLRPEAVFFAVEQNVPETSKILLMTPQGRQLTQELVKELSQEKNLAIICGHYEGFDERIRSLAHDEVSIGDYVLTGGELPAMVVVDAVCRLIPGVLGKEQSPLSDSFYQGLLEYPQYTRPRDFRGMTVPEVLLSGNHEQIRVWRRKEALRRTLVRRPELLEKKKPLLSAEDLKLLKEVYGEENMEDE